MNGCSFFFMMLQYRRPTLTNNTHVLINKRDGRFNWDLAVVKKLFYYNFHGKDYAFAVIQRFAKVAPYLDISTGLKIVRPEPLDQICVIPVSNILKTVVLLKFSETFERYDDEQVMFILSDYH